MARKKTSFMTRQMRENQRARRPAKLRANHILSHNLSTSVLQFGDPQPYVQLSCVEVQRHLDASFHINLVS